jgi:hypothetical protein
MLNNGMINLSLSLFTFYKLMNNELGMIWKETILALGAILALYWRD